MRANSTSSFYRSLRSRTSSLLALSAAAVAALAAPRASATTLYWDPDSALGGNGTWDDNNTQAWRTVNAAGAPDAKWTPNDGTLDAQFGGTVATSYTVTVTGTVKANSILLAKTLNVYTWGGTGTIELTSGVIATNVATTSTNGMAFNRPITVTGGGDLIVANNTAAGDAFVLLAAANNYGNLKFTSSGTQLGRDVVNLNNLQAIKNQNGNAATIYMNRNAAQVGFAGTSIWDGQPFYCNIVLNPDNNTQAGFTNTLGVNASYDIDYYGTISSGATGSNVANLRFALGTSGGTGVINLKNAASYNGSTSFVNANAATHFAGTIRNDSGADDVLPVTTRLIFGPTSATAAAGAFDLNGRSQTITGISTLSAPVAIGGVVNTSATPGTLKINATATQAQYTGNVGIPWESLTANSGQLTSIYKRGGGTYSTNDNISLELLASSSPTASVTFARAPGMTYNGGTTIRGGILILNNTSGSGTGSGTINVGNGTGNLASIGGSGTVTGDLHLLNQGQVTPGSTGINVGRFNTGNQEWAAGGSYRFDITSFATGPGTGYDQVKTSTGTAVNITATTGNKFTISVNGAPSDIAFGQDWIIADGANAVQLNGVAVTDATAFNAGGWMDYFVVDESGLTTSAGIQTVQISPDLTDVVLHYDVPEPSSATLLLSGATLLLSRRSRRQQKAMLV